MADQLDPYDQLDRLGALWSPDLNAYAAGQLDASQIRCALCELAPCQCPLFGTPEYLALVGRRHGRRGAPPGRAGVEAVEPDEPVDVDRCGCGHPECGAC